MKRMYEFVCGECHHVTEKLTGYETVEVQCLACGNPAGRKVSAPAIKLEGWSGSFPGAANKFNRIHREKLDAERKANS
jgi:predicted nucleic acid-binding Zn ribbon protein